jgi:pimeloyl-ACP methyl ester carboxylesterase
MFKSFSDAPDVVPTEETVRIPVGDVVFDATHAGPAAGTPVLLLHGFPGSRASWRPVLPTLTAAGMQVLAPDQRGYSAGARPPAVADYAVDHLVGDVLGLLDAMGWSRVHLVGHDWGAVVSWFVAARHPERLHSLTALSVPHPAAFGWALANDAEQQEGSAYIRLLRTEGKAERVLLEDGGRRLRAMFSSGVPADIVDSHLRLLAQPEAPTGALSWYRAMGDGFADLTRVPVPTTFIWGAADEALRRAGAERCGRHVSGPYRFVELADIDHWIPERAGDRVAAEVLRHATGGSA